MKTTVKFLHSLHACDSGVNFAKRHKLIELDVSNALRQAVRIQSKNGFDYANWLIATLISDENKANYANFCVEKVSKGIYSSPELRPCIQGVRDNARRSIYGEHRRYFAVKAAQCAVQTALLAYGSSNEMVDDIINYGIKLYEGEQNAN